MIIYPSDIARFEEKYIPEPNTGCWLWTAALSDKGYGVFRLGEKMIYAHRFSFMIAHGYIPGEVILDHRCRIRSCVNDEHLVPGDDRDNILADGSLALAKINIDKTHCVRGHPYDEHNTYIDSRGWRQCRACWHIKDVEKWARRSR